MTKKELLKKIKLLGDLTNDQRNSVVCSLIGHSKIQTFCFGYYSCARCGTQIGDSLGGAYSGENAVVVGHDCDTCRSNFKNCTWKDKIFSPNPFITEPAGAPDS